MYVYLKLKMTKPMAKYSRYIQHWLVNTDVRQNKKNDRKDYKIR